jgi:hypothetical protein
VPYRVYPDISMDADVQTGMLIGLTQAFPSGTYYSQYKIGGTSLASPLFAGVIADANQAAGNSDRLAQRLTRPGRPARPAPEPLRRARAGTHKRRPGPGPGCRSW